MIVECTFEGTITSTGATYRPSYVEVLTERDGLIGAVRDYENLAYRATQIVDPRTRLSVPTGEILRSKELTNAI